ncbi:uncharacterized protein N7459_006134 [Penicillium hispanicum]|uniref:uncharacterized protein n=1 Tax=Penicillium hispanicum TaxID=1080232 RepID=UPI00253FCC27|nr:uncharacterized protein N7459_006134 [Penicillium hispanicum]KAJ5580149.1 hypothetical protein N7459_006134 [Penicillium hispanicum]
MLSSKCWFPNSLVGPGTIIPLGKPRAEWKVTQRLTEHESQMEAGAVQDGSRPSFAAVKFRCHDINDPSKEAFMRVYLQIPYAGTESEPAAERARQARTRYLPDELNALRSMTSQGSTITPRLLGYMEDKQDESGWVPGGFIVYLAWKIVPGVRLGDHFEAVEFWKLSPDDRDAVRLAFSRGFEYDYIID